MTGRRIAIAAAVLLHLFTIALEAQITQQSLTQPTPQARQQLVNALQEYRTKKDVHNEALTLLQLGIADAGLGNMDGARSNINEAVAKMRANDDPMGAWIGLIFIAQIEVALGRPKEAIPHLEKAFAVINEAKASTTPLNVKTFMAFGSVAGLSPDIAAKLDATSMAMMKPMMFQYSIEPMTHDVYGSVLTQVGQYDKAEAELKAAAAVSALTMGMFDFSIESHFGDLRFRQERYDEARTHYMKALDASSKMPVVMPAMADQQMKAGIYDRLARLETIKGRPEEAKRWYEKARDLGKPRAEKK